MVTTNMHDGIKPFFVGSKLGFDPYLKKDIFAGRLRIRAINFYNDKKKVCAYTPLRVTFMS